MKMFLGIVGSVLTIGGLALFLFPTLHGETAPKTDKTVPDGTIVLASSNQRGMSYVGRSGTINGELNPTVSVIEGDTVVLQFRNTAGGVHDLVVPAFDVKTDRIYGNKSTEIRFVPGQTGTFPYFCSVAGHRQAGMEGTIVVESDQSSKETPGT